MASAKTSFPTPVSPVISIGKLDFAYSSIEFFNVLISEEIPIILIEDLKFAGSVPVFF